MTITNSKNTGRNRFYTATLLVLFLFVNTGIAGAQTGTGIKLVLQITVDGLRGDLINRYSAGFGQGGFHYLLG